MPPPILLVDKHKINRYNKNKYIKGDKTMVFAIVVGGIAAIVATVYLCIKVLPAKYDGTFDKKIFQILHDYFNFKTLYLESVLKVIFTLASVSSIVVGAVMATVGNVFWFIGSIVDAVRYGYGVDDWIFRNLFTNFFGGIAIAVLGPIALRLVYEGIIMFILLVKNVIDINNKMKPIAAAPEETVEVAEEVTEEE